MPTRSSSTPGGIPVADLLRALQAALFTAASTVHLWRDAAIFVLAAIVIGALWFYAEASGG